MMPGIRLFEFWRAGRFDFYPKTQPFHFKPSETLNPTKPSKLSTIPKP